MQYCLSPIHLCVNLDNFHFEILASFRDLFMFRQVPNSEFQCEDVVIQFTSSKQVSYNKGSQARLLGPL